jgi:hypothetical protein
LVTRLPHPASEYAPKPAHIVPTAVFAAEASMERVTVIRTARVPQNFLVRVENDSPSVQRNAARAWLRPWLGWCATRGLWWMRVSRGHCADSGLPLIKVSGGS